MKLGIGVIAPSAKTPQVELALGAERLRDAGFNVHIHPQVKKGFRFFAGDDVARASGIEDFAFDPRVHVLWCARGGYGAARLLPLLEKLTAERGVPERKLLVGYSDATVLLEYVRTRWGWSALHAAMPGLRDFQRLTDLEWDSTLRLVLGEHVRSPWGTLRLRFHRRAPARAVEAPLVGGNLTVWASVAGTPFAGKTRGKILFFEDIDEALYRVDRVVQQLVLSGAFEGAAGIVLGDFLRCRDAVPNVLKAAPGERVRQRVLESPRPAELMPLRKVLPEQKTLLEIFGEVAQRYRIPLAYGLPAGHGPGHAPVPLGAKYRLSPNGRLEMVDWSWVR